MPETQEVSMEEYVASRTSAPVETKSAATTPQEKVETAPESATGTPESEEAQKAKGGGWQRRIDKLTKRTSEVEESNKLLREENERLKLAGRDPAELKPNTSTEPGARPKPKSTDPKYKGETAFDDYIEDLGRWAAAEEAAKLKTELTTEQKQAHEKAQQAQHEKVVTESFTRKSAAAKENHADFHEVIFDPESEAQKLIAGSVIDGFILDPENEGPEVLYHLCKNPGEIDRISALSPFKQVRELGKIEESLNVAKADSSPEPKKASLPAPIKPVTTSTSKSAAKPETMSMEDYAKWRTANRR